MPEGENEQFARNPHINAHIHEMLADFSEPSRSRMRKKLRQDRNALQDQETDQADQHARHTFREFLVAHRLNRRGFDLEYNKKIGEQTPDWYDHKKNLLLEVFTCERGGSSNPSRRVADRFAEKIAKYRKAVQDSALSFVVAVHGDFLANFDSTDCKQTIDDDHTFERNPDLSGVIYFGESEPIWVRQFDGSKKLKQQYLCHYYTNPRALHPIDLTESPSSEEV